MTEETPSRELAVEEVTVERQAERLALSFLARNVGDHSLYVQCGVRQVEWDEAQEKATIALSDRGRRVEGHHDTVPKTTVVEAGQTRRIEVQIPLELTRLLPLEGGGFDFDKIDLTRARTLRVVVGAARTPFYLNPKEKSRLAQLKRWGQDVEVTVRMPAGKGPRGR
jgi:hypothetical protein